MLGALGECFNRACSRPTGRGAFECPGERRERSRKKRSRFIASNISKRRIRNGNRMGRNVVRAFSYERSQGHFIDGVFISLVEECRSRKRQIASLHRDLERGLSNILQHCCVWSTRWWLAELRSLDEPRWRRQRQIMRPRCGGRESSTLSTFACSQV